MSSGTTSKKKRLAVVFTLEHGKQKDTPSVIVYHTKPKIPLMRKLEKIFNGLKGKSSEIASNQPYFNTLTSTCLSSLLVILYTSKCFNEPVVCLPCARHTQPQSVHMSLQKNEFESKKKWLYSS